MSKHERRNYPRTEAGGFLNWKYDELLLHFGLRNGIHTQIDWFRSCLLIVLLFCHMLFG